MTVPDGRVVVTGGFGSAADTATFTLLYDPATDRWSEGPASLFRRFDLTAFLLADGKVLAPGLGDGSESEIFGPETNTWTRTVSFREGHNGGAGLALDDGSILLIGGGDRSGSTLTDAVEIFRRGRAP